MDDPIGEPGIGADQEVGGDEDRDEENGNCPRGEKANAEADNPKEQLSRRHSVAAVHERSLRRARRKRKLTGIEMRTLFLLAALVWASPAWATQFTLEKRLDAIPADHTGVHARATCDQWLPGTAAALEVFMKYGGRWVSVSAHTTEKTCSKSGVVMLDFGWLAVRQNGVMRQLGRPEAIMARLTANKAAKSVLTLSTAADFTFTKGGTR
jgi:hypothetical protein